MMFRKDTEEGYTINHVVISLNFWKLNTLHHISELGRAQLLTILAMSVQNPELAGYLLTGNQSNFLPVGGSTARLYDFPQFSSTSV